MTTDAIGLQRWRRLMQAGFFLLFLAAPGLNWLRFDLNETQLWFLGYRWTLGIEALVHGQATASETAGHILMWGFLPALVLAGVFLGVAYRFGRVYCGWL